MSKFNKLELSWAVSKGVDTYGYNICRLDDTKNGKRYRCMGGGYDMVGTVFADWLQDVYQMRLCQLNIFASGFYRKATGYESNPNTKYYGMTYFVDENRIGLDGACGLESMLEIARAIGLDIERIYVEKGKRRGETLGWWITDTKAE